ncbi:hypothetical protein [Streptomyces sp. 4F14]|uniref:hypothetical protein n=1 Tax=Streptomyces sp. 4F14 TaxID=3394380 RepID=UPI003A8A1AD4
MTRVLLIGQVHETIDFSDPAVPPGLTIETIGESLRAGLRLVGERGWKVDLIAVMPDSTAGPAVEKWLVSHPAYDCVVVGGGIRLPARNLVFFEAVVNAVHRAAPAAAIGFNTVPETTVDAAARWVATPW